MATNGNRGRFSDRLKKIAFRKRNRMVYEENENNKIRYQNILKVLAAIPGMVYSNVRIGDSKKSEINHNTNNKKIKQLSLINDIDVGKIRKKQEIYFNGRKILVNADIDIGKNDELKEDNSIKCDDGIKSFDNPNNFNSNIIDTKKNNGNHEDIDDYQKKDREKVEKLEKEILNIIKKKLVLSINNLELLQTDLYILSEINEDAKTQEECEKQIEEIKELLKEIEELKEQYDFLKDNYDFEYLMALDDDNLIDKIIELKDIFDNNEIRAFVEDYKLLDEYKYLYLKIDKIQEETNDLEEEKEKELEELKDRDIEFEKLKDKVYNMANVDYIYGNLFNEQREILMEMESKISKIDSYEQVNYHLEGLNRLILNSFRYLGLMMLNPLKGVFPAIAIQTLMTRDALRGIYHGLEWKEDRKMVYKATDYSSVLDNTLDTMDNISNYLNENLSDLIKLKSTYNDKFKEYEDDIYEYKEVIKKINDMENIMLGNKIKVEMMKKKALQRKKDNHKKLMLVHELNQQQEK